MTRAAAAQATDSSPTVLPPRERILATARELFYRQGLHSVGVDAIAEAAGTNKMTLYRHFASKDLLIAECMRQIVADFEAEWRETSARSSPDPKSQLEAWLHVCFETKRRDHNRGCALANAAIQIPDKDHPAKRVIEDSKRRFHDMTIEFGRNAGLKDPELLADELFLLCEGAWASMESVGADGPAARLPRLIKNLIESHAPSA